MTYTGHVIPGGPTDIRRLERATIRKMSVSLGISYGLLWDIAILGGANTRVEIQSDLRKIEYWQDKKTREWRYRIRQGAKIILGPGESYKRFGTMRRVMVNAFAKIRDGLFDLVEVER